MEGHDLATGLGAWCLGLVGGVAGCYCRFETDE